MKNTVLAALFILILSPLSASAMSYMSPTVYGGMQYSGYAPQMGGFNPFMQQYSYGSQNPYNPYQQYQYGYQNYGSYSSGYGYGSNYGTGYAMNNPYAGATVYPFGVPQTYTNGYSYAQGTAYPNSLVVDTFPQYSNFAPNYYYGYPTGEKLFTGDPLCYQPAYGGTASCYFDATQPVRDPYTGRTY